MTDIRVYSNFAISIIRIYDLTLQYNVIKKKKKKDISSKIHFEFSFFFVNQ